MAKRKRLTPARPESLTAAGVLAGASDTPRRPPIAQVAADAATVSALRELSDELTQAREEGRMVLSLPLDAVVADHLARDRVMADEAATGALMASLRQRGQQAPIEVQPLPQGGYGLISGWRRLLALQALHEETGEARFSAVQALLRRPEDQAQAYVAMVEENEIRADLSFYERARIVRLAVERGVFDTEKLALQNLFSTASYAKRSKIKSFLALVDGLGGALRFPAHISERAGLALAQVLDGKKAATARISAALRVAAPETAEAEAKLLAELMAAEKARARGKPAAARKPAVKMPRPRRVAPGIALSAVQGRVELSGEGIDPDLIAQLKAWLQTRG